MPPECGDAVARRLAAAATSLGLTLDAEQQARLVRYLGLIAQWNRVYNLTAVRDPADMVTHHLLDCLAVVRPLAAGAPPGGHRLRLLDVGSGAGLPGVVLAIARPDWDVTCVDAVAKKATFVRQVAAELGLPHLAALHGRVEEGATFGSRRFDLIVSRAFASLEEFTRLTRHVLAPGGCWAAMKAHLADAETAALPRDLDMFHVEQLTVPELDATRCLVWIRPHDPSAGTPAVPRQ